MYCFTHTSQQMLGLSWFIGIAISGWTQIGKCITLLTHVSKCWGWEKIEHYRWHLLNKKYCNKLCTAANQVPIWNEARTKLNRLVMRRTVLPGTGRHQIKISKNPILQTDLNNLQLWKDQNSFIRPKDPENMWRWLGWQREQLWGWG